MKYQSKIGLEVHVELATKSKMFCRCENYSGGDDPNTRVCPVCLGLPGTLPVINKQAIELGAKMALALNCRVNLSSRFDRKNYFYPDLPKGYQISQFFQPLAQAGHMSVYIGDEARKIRINRLHMEEDTAKMTHAGDVSLLDFNRSGIPLMEIVTEPDITSPAEARLFLKNLKDLVVWLGVSTARMQLGELRCDANISLLDENDVQVGEVVEIKNLNSFKNVESSLSYEHGRQIECVKAGELIIKETRGWDVAKQVTYSQRKKEHFHDYRYFPEPDLPAVKFTEDEVGNMASKLGILPDEMRQTMQTEYGLSEKYIVGFLNNIDLFYFYEQVLSELENRIDEEKVDKKEIWVSDEEMKNKIAGFILTEITVDVKSAEFKLTAENLAELLLMFYRNQINNRMTKDILAEMLITGGDPSNIAVSKGWQMISAKDDWEEVIMAVIERNSDQVEQYRQGKEQILAYFIGQVMQQTKGRANPRLVKEILLKKLAE
ncbi:MAG: Asp-tRNA(Asn)/Glu-tRNA(Gln) amidotransferase subunit GatB [Patescibacteria group bacterium]